MSTDASTDRLRESGLHIVMLSIHGLIRGHDLELGRDSDTGGQTLYVVELARALAERDDVDRVDLLTRRIVDPDLSQDYSEPEESLSENARILRFDCGGEQYVRKEELWDHLDTFVDNALFYYREQGVFPDVVHAHYADAGYVGVRMASILGLPLVYTGHSLGRVKRRQLLASGMSAEELERRYHISRRINAEEYTLGAADLVVTSTRNEIHKQYGLYHRGDENKMQVIPPGIDLARFQPPQGDEWDTPVFGKLLPFLREPRKPMILALSRPDHRKNIATLVQAYGESPELRELANLVIVAGNREDLDEIEDSQAEVLKDILVAIDRHDLYGRVAYPKHHRAVDVPVFYRLAALSRGIFVNPAFTEPFGLTLLEAAACGLPLVATEDGGPTDIIANCENGALVDPTDVEQMAERMREILEDESRWDTFSRNGREGTRRRYAWQTHAERYRQALLPLVKKEEPQPEPAMPRRPMLYHDRAIFTDLDQNLLGDREALNRFLGVLRENRHRATFGIATGRRLDSALAVMKKYGVPKPDVLISSVGTEISYAPDMSRDRLWHRHLNHLWTPDHVQEVLAELPGLVKQGSHEQSRFKLSYHIDPTKAPSIEEIDRLLQEADQMVNVFLSFGRYLDVVPIRASKGQALRWFAERWQIPVQRILAAGGSGTDEDMMRGATLAVVVANRHEEELSALTDIDSIYFADAPFADGIVEALEFYDFFGSCESPVRS